MKYPDYVCEGCGNGIVEPEEECDDGNENDLDGCSSICETEEGSICDTHEFKFS